MSAGGGPYHHETSFQLILHPVLDTQLPKQGRRGNLIKRLQVISKLHRTISSHELRKQGKTPDKTRVSSHERTSPSTIRRQSWYTTTAILPPNMTIRPPYPQWLSQQVLPVTTEAQTDWKMEITCSQYSPKSGTYQLYLLRLKSVGTL